MGRALHGDSGDTLWSGSPVILWGYCGVGRSRDSFNIPLGWALQAFCVGLGTPRDFVGILWGGIRVMADE